MRTVDFFMLLIRLFLGFVFFSSGLAKLTGGQFGSLIGPPDLIKTLAKYGLGQFGYAIAISQVFCGSLVLSQRFSLIGLIALVPINVSILAFTISQNWGGTPYINAFLLGLNLLVLLYEFNTLKILFTIDAENIQPSKSSSLFTEPWKALGILLLSGLAVFISFTSATGTNIAGSLALILVLINLFQVRIYSITQKLTLLTYGITTIIVADFLLLKKVFPYPKYLLGGIVVLGFVCFVMSLLLPLFKRRKEIV